MIVISSFVSVAINPEESCMISGMFPMPVGKR